MLLESALVEVDWLHDHLNQVMVLDASWHLPAHERDGRSEFMDEHIVSARYFDYDNEIKDQNSVFPRMMPDAETFSVLVAGLGISNETALVIYDTNGMFSAPRAWWMFKSMGHEQVAVLNGGMQAWKQAAYPVASGEATVGDPGKYTASPSVDTFVDANYVMSVLSDPKHCLLDARSQDRFDQAHMPSAINLPYSELIEEGHLKGRQEIARLFKDRNPSDEHVVCTCGSGVTACVLALGAYLSGHQAISVYDASWSQWGSSDVFPKV